jgi:hypothetical protein
VLNHLIERATTRAVGLTVVVVIVVAVVPVTVLSVAPGDDSVGRVVSQVSHARTHPTSAPAKVPARVKFRSDAEALIASLKSAEAGCVASITAGMTSSSHRASETQPILASATNRLDAAVRPLTARVQKDVDDVARARTLSPQQLAAYVADIDTIRLIALPTNTNKGSIANLCAAVTVQVEQQLAALPPPGDGSDGGD